MTVAMNGLGRRSGAPPSRGDAGDRGQMPTAWHLRGRCQLGVRPSACGNAG